MAVASPVLERRVSTQEKEYREVENVRVNMSADERHNAQISSIYQRLINPESTIDDIIAKEPAQAPVTEQPVVSVQAESRPYLVQNARADSDIFRADSIINRRPVEVSSPVMEVQSSDEEENEDLRPTQTTIQYRTAGIKKVEEEGVISNSSSSKKIILSKKEKIVIAAVVSVIVALFVLIIVNSAIISNINTDISYLQSSLTSAKAAYSGISDEVNDYLGNISETVSDFAYSKGMILK